MKKVFCAILSLSLILLPCSVFADTASGSAISLYDRLKLAELSGIATPSSAVALAATTAAQDVYITGFTYPSGGTPYYFYNGSSVNSNFISNSTMLGGLATGITQSIANSAQGLASKISDHTSVLNTIKKSLSSISGYVDGLESAISTANSHLLTIANKSIASPSDISTAASNIVSAIEDSSIAIPQSLLDDVDLISGNSISKSAIQPWIIPADNYDHSASEWRYYFRTYLNNNGLLSTSDFYNTNILMLYKRALSDISNNTGYLGNRTISGVIGSGISYPLYNSDLTSSNMSKNSIWNTLLEMGSNTSLHLSRLAYVLANDEEIEARQAAQTNSSAVVDNFIKPSGSASASASDFGSIADIASAGSDSLSSGVDPSVLINQLGGDGDGWTWFTQQIQDELSAPSGRSNLRSNSKSNSSDTPYLDAYYRDLEEKIGFKLW